MHILSRVLPLIALFSSPALATSLEADQGNWTVEGCILVRMAAQVRQSGGRGGLLTLYNINIYIIYMAGWSTSNVVTMTGGSSPRQTWTTRWRRPSRSWPWPGGSSSAAWRRHSGLGGGAGTLSGQVRSGQVM